MERGVKHPTIALGEPTEWPMLAELLRSRVRALRSFAADDDLWDYDEAEFEGPRTGTG